jgi:anti-sigma28 factor (negative regulator of flagellin synthesis)
VESIRNAIASGTYKVDSDKIAHGLINTERALGKLK